MNTRTTVESDCVKNNGNSAEIKIYSRENRNYDFSSEKKVSAYTVDDVKKWRSTAICDGFSGPALCTLIPDSCTVTEELNGTHEATFVVSADRFGKYKNVREFNFARVLNNLFYIYKVDYSMTGKALKITAHCLQATYLLKNYFCPDMLFYPTSPIVFDNPKIKVDDWLCRTYSNFLGYTKYVSCDGNLINFADKNYYHQKFVIKSDITNIISEEYLTKENPIIIEPYNRSFLETLLDEKESFLSVLTGEIYRFGFYMSINKKKEDSKYNAFSITIGNNQNGIKRTVDYSKFCTDFKYEYSYSVPDGESKKTYFKTVSVRAPSRYGCPTQIFKSYYEKYDENPGMMAAYYAKKYFDEHFALKVTYNVSVSGITNNSDFSGLTETSDIRVGDEGYISDVYFGDIIKVKVTKIVFDGKTGGVKSAEFEYTSDYVAQQNDTQYLDPEFIPESVKICRLWKDVTAMKWKEVATKTWETLKGE